MSQVLQVGSSSQDLQRALGRFAARWEAAAMGVSSTKSEAKVVCHLWGGGVLLPQLEGFLESWGLVRE